MTQRRLAILAERQFSFHAAKTAAGVLRYGTDPIVAVIDSEHAGQRAGDVLGWLGRGAGTPVVGSLQAALDLPEPPTVLLIGIAPTGGRLPAEWRPVILGAIRAGLDVESGLHTFVGDDPELAAAAGEAGVRIVDHRRPPERMATAVGRRHLPRKRVILTVATDCALGKMSVALELRRAALDDGRSASFVPTGQTGMMIEGWGVAVDRVVADFLQGACEDLVAEGEARGDWVFVEGQGSLDHPAYSSVTLGLIHGTTPHAMVMVHKPGLEAHDFEHLPERSFPLAELGPFIDLHERMAGLVAPSRVVAIALNTMLIPDETEARRVIDETAGRTGLPVDDPVRFGPTPLWRRIEAAVEALPWVRVGATT